MSCTPGNGYDDVRITGRSVRWEAVLGPHDWIKDGAPLTSSCLSYQVRTGWRMEAQPGLARMLNEGILSDILVNDVGGSIRAHRAVLGARSPVFTSMFSHDLKEKKESTLDISDMSIGACRAFIGYLYGDLRGKEFLAHRSELLRAGHKYDVVELKRACEESMLNDVDTDSALDGLHTAHLYVLPMLKSFCMTLLKDFRKMYEVLEDFHEFMRTADPDLVAEVKANLQTNNCG
ncbi:BTB/POZ domain-containing protein [Dichanthelium oligosanthes]|uniref:BTB/POZ domain-containing protein n=1 Tax=Dichanthelium oligosanthes TaxID=888268 RepID=A0A1E5WIX4_9POAL|nr:BTB/POZ domain-containing protein [Dichanthelium oligosanthes]